MNPTPQVSAMTLLALLAGAVGLVAVVAVVTRAARLLPVRRAWRRGIERWTPIVGSVVGVGYLGWALTVATRGSDVPAYAVLLAFGLLLLAVAWSPLRDVVGGVLWRATRPWRVGDPITVGDLRGRIAALGYRVVVLDTDRGEQVLVPYGMLLRQAVMLRGLAAGDIPHQFTIQAPMDVAVDELREQLLRSLSLCHGASVLRPPRVQPAADGSLDITVFVLSREFAGRVEACARRVVESLGADVGEGAAAPEAEVEPSD